MPQKTVALGMSSSPCSLPQVSKFDFHVQPQNYCSLDAGQLVEERLLASGEQVTKDK
jgi:hypothetical protein